MEGGNSNSTSAVDEMNAAAWTEISANITEGMKEILEAEEKVGSALDERKELEKIVKGLREKFAAANSVSSIRHTRDFITLPMLVIILILIYHDVNLPQRTRTSVKWKLEVSKQNGNRNILMTRMMMITWKTLKERL